MADPVLRVRAVDDTRAAFDSVEGRLRKLSGSAGLIKSAFGGITGLVGAAGLLGLARDIHRVVTEAEQSEARLTAVLRATQNAVGLTRDELNGLINDLAGQTLFDDEAVRNATAVLATFKNVAGDTFRQTLSLATDLSGLLGGDLNAAVLQLGKALEDPVRGIAALRRSGVSFSESQQEVIKNLVESNRLLEAQKIVLQTVAGQIGGVAREMNTGLVGATANAAKAWDNLLESFGRTQSVSAPVTQTLNAMAFAFGALEKSIQEADARVKGSVLFRANPNLSGLGQAASRAGELSKEQAEALRAAGARLPQRTRLAPEGAGAGGGSDEARREAERTTKFLDDYLRKLREDSAQEALDTNARVLEEQAQQDRAAAEERRSTEDDLNQYIADLRMQTAEESIAASERLAAQEDRYRQSVEATAEAYRRLADPAREYKQQLEEIARLQDSGALTPDEAAKAREAIEKEIEAIGRKTSDVGRELGLTFSSAIEDAILQMRELGDIADAVFQDIARVAIRKSITEPLLGAVGGIFDSAGGGGGAGIAGLFAGLFANAEGGIMTSRGPVNLRAFAGGGIATRPTLAMFGEGRMPEAFVPLPDGRSIPVTMRGAQGGGGVTVTMNVYAQDAGSFRRSERQILAELRGRLR